MKPNDISMLILLILLILLLAAGQEKQRILEWFEDQNPAKQWMVGTGLVLFVTVTVAYIFWN